MPNNNEKIKNLLLCRDNLTPLMEVYLDQLKKRYEWSREARTSFFRVKRIIFSISSDLKKEAKKEEKKADLINELILEIRRESAEIIDNFQSQISPDGIKGLSELSELTRRNFTVDYADTMHGFILRNVNVPKRKLLYSLRKRANIDYANSERIRVAEWASEQLTLLADNYMGRSYKGFKHGEFASELKKILTVLQKFSFFTQSERLHEILRWENDWNEPEYPDTEDIVDVLHAARQPSMYIRRGYTVLEYSRVVYKSMNYFHRAVREKREYIGTKRAYNRLIDALSALGSYYNSQYVQGGGQPKNYHGHYAGEHE